MLLNDLGLKISFQKFKNALVSRGCFEYKIGSVRGLRRLKIISVVENI
jgi:hypothetical protein